MELSRERLSNFFKDFNEFWVDLNTLVDQDKLTGWYECFQRDYPETFRVMEAMETEEGQTRPKKPNIAEEEQTRSKKSHLAEIRERLLCKRMTERFIDYQGVMFDSNLDLMAKINHLQKAINDATRGKVYFASLLGELLQNCFDELKEAYKKTLEEVKIKRQWALVLNYNQLQYCTVSLHFIQINFKAIEEICESEPYNWK